ncbi:hypothetical protein ABTY20_17090 [Streptomyces sp. NPDC126497]|uniref:hypothetical protein n=1 Tax=Streptomyces sp. NPDC126497 TaxID=3155313 RepID=UPI00332D683C
MTAHAGRSTECGVLITGAARGTGAAAAPRFAGDVAAAVAFPASRGAARLTGTTPTVDGGIAAVDAGFRRALGGMPPR